jgi:hypothetical protein
MSRVLLLRPWLPTGALLMTVSLLIATESVKPEAKITAAEEKALAASLEKATVKGKYQMLLRQIKVPNDRVIYGDFNDYGSYQATAYANFKDLPAGFWVYSAPYWYIWRDLKTTPKPNRNWGPEQVTGAPDTLQAGDVATAWASRTPDDQDEWLLLEYARPVVPKEILVHETFNPGAVTRATAFRLDGTEVEVWKGKDPSAGKDIGVSVLPVKEKFLTNRIKIYIESTKVPGWNEIDAVGLKDANGKTVWARGVEASSTYAEQSATPQTDPRDQRIRQLEREIAELRDTVRRLEDMLDKLEREKKK